MSSSRVRLRELLTLSVALLLVTSGLVVGMHSVVAQEETDSQGLDIEFTLPTDTISPSESLTMNVIIENNGDESSPAPVFHLTGLPEGWSVVSWSNAEAAYRDSTNEWLWTEIQPGEQVSLEITLEPSDAAEEVSIGGEVTDGKSASLTNSVEVTVEEEDSPSSPDEGDSEPDDGTNRDAGDAGEDRPDTTFVEVNTPNGTTKTQLELPENATAEYAEQRTIEGNQSNETTVSFSSNASVSTISFENTTGISGNITVAGLGDVETLTEEAPGQTIDAFYISGSPAIENATVTVELTLPSSAVNQTGNGTSIQIAHRADGTWEVLSTTTERRSDGGVTVSFVTDGFSPFTVAAVDSPDAAITGVQETVEPGESITLNGSESEAGYGNIVKYEWKINGQTLSGGTVTTSIDESGRYTAELVVTNDVGDSATTQTTLVVESQSETTVTTTESESESSSTATETDVDTKTTETTGPGLGVSVALVAITLFVLIGTHRDR